MLVADWKGCSQCRREHAKLDRNARCLFTTEIWPSCDLTHLLCICADTSKHLSTAEVVGACIGAVLCAALAVALGGLLLWRWRFRRQHHSSMGSASNELVGLFWSHADLMCH